MTMPLSGPRRRVRMKDVASRCNVSISTVSLVLSGDPRIPEDTARLVLQTVKAMEYRPSVLARSLARRSSRTIGVILPEFAFSRNKPFYSQALEGIHAQTQVAGYKLVLETASRVFLARRYYLRLLREQSVDAMIYLAASLNDKVLGEMEAESFPFALVGGYVDGANLTCFRADDGEGAKIAVRHLVSLGHKAIGHLAGTSDLSIGRDRERGYRDAMAEAAIAVSPSWVGPGQFEMETAERVTGDLVRAGVTAIFAGSDVMAFGALRALRRLGKRVPQDVAVVGMDDLEMSEWIAPGLTTVRYDISAMAAAAARYVMRRAQSPLVQKNAGGDIPAPKLIVRDSCGGKI